jgi:hypothetical protein
MDKRNRPMTDTEAFAEEQDNIRAASIRAEIERSLPVTRGEFEDYKAAVIAALRETSRVLSWQAPASELFDRFADELEKGI